eukprot:1134250-Pelagomonas_calceolata.AAC.3
MTKGPKRGGACMHDVECKESCLSMHAWKADCCRHASKEVALVHCYPKKALSPHVAEMLTTNLQYGVPVTQTLAQVHRSLCIGSALGILSLVVILYHQHRVPGPARLGSTCAAAAGCRGLLSTGWSDKGCCSTAISDRHSNGF